MHRASTDDSRAAGHRAGRGSCATIRAARSLAILSVVVLSVACTGSESPQIGTGTNPVVLLAVDGLRADRLGCYGYDGDTSPNLDTLAGESVVFEWAFSQSPVPAPSLVSILTGLYPTTHDVVEPGDALREEASTVAEVLGSRGYATAALLAGDSQPAGLEQGFDRFDVIDASAPDDLAATATTWLEEHRSKEFLLLIRVGVAAPAAESPEEAGVRYDDAVRSLDSWIGDLLDELRRLGLDREATIAVVGTHGRALGEHDATPAASLHTTTTRVPLLLRLPGGRPARSIGKIVETVDVMPTLLELAGAETPVAVQGRSLVPLIEKRGKPPYVAFGEAPNGGGQRFVALGGYRLLLSHEDDAARLYHLPDDPLERNDLAGNEAEAERIAVLRRHLDAWEEMVAASSLDPDREEAPMDEDTLEQLRSLGYIQ
jgi:arylsulfatase A-like enzyme